MTQFASLMSSIDFDYLLLAVVGTRAFRLDVNSFEQVHAIVFPWFHFSLDETGAGATGGFVSVRNVIGDHLTSPSFRCLAAIRSWRLEVARCGRW